MREGGVREGEVRDGVTRAQCNRQNYGPDLET